MTSLAVRNSPFESQLHEIDQILSTMNHTTDTLFEQPLDMAKFVKLKTDADRINSLLYNLRHDPKAAQILGPLKTRVCATFDAFAKTAETKLDQLLPALYETVNQYFLSHQSCLIFIAERAYLEIETVDLTIAQLRALSSRFNEVSFEKKTLTLSCPKTNPFKATVDEIGNFLVVGNNSLRFPRTDYHSFASCMLILEKAVLLIDQGHEMPLSGNEKKAIEKWIDNLTQWMDKNQLEHGILKGEEKFADLRVLISSIQNAAQSAVNAMLARAANRFDPDFFLLFMLCRLHNPIPICQTSYLSWIKDNSWRYWDSMQYMENSKLSSHVCIQFTEDFIHKWQLSSDPSSKEFLSKTFYKSEYETFKVVANADKNNPVVRSLAELILIAQELGIESTLPLSMGRLDPPEHIEAKKALNQEMAPVIALQIINHELDPETKATILDHAHKTPDGKPIIDKTFLQLIENILIEVAYGCDSVPKNLTLTGTSSSDSKK